MADPADENYGTSPTTTDPKATRSLTPPQRDAITTSQYLAASQNSSSPQKRKGTMMADATTDGKDKNDVQRDIALEELGVIHEISMNDAEKIYKDVASDDDMDRFFAENKHLYQSGRWVEFTSAVAFEHLMYGPYVALNNAAVAHFHPNLPVGVSRIAVDTHKVRIRHDDPAEYTSPDICIKASGSSFALSNNPGNTKGIAYTNAASVVDGKREETKCHSARDHAKQTAIYVRQILMQQPNRNSVSAMVFTQDRCRLLRFDRSGVFVTPLFNIHTENGKKLFVRYILGISSPNEAVLGFDTSVQWIIGEDGKKKSGTITVFDETKKASVTYDLDMDAAVLVRPGVRCRGTVGWHAKDRATGQKVFIKDSWRSDGREPEYEFLLKANESHLPGIPKLLCYQDELAKTTTLRAGLDTFENRNLKDFFNRTKLRMVMTMYGPSIWFFHSRVQLLLALRDAIVAHRELLKVHILHRDIAVLNILLGLPGASEGFEGLLADLDMAIYVWREESDVSQDPRSAYRVYQSISNLRTSNVFLPAHNYMDDLEGIFYSLYHVMHHFQAPGVRVRQIPPTLQHFRLDSNELVIAAKKSVLTGLSEPLPPYWGKHCEGLLESFKEVIKSMFIAKEPLWVNVTAANAKAASASLKKICVERVHGDYQDILKAFDTAIDALKDEGLNEQELKAYPVNPEPYPLYRPVDLDMKSPAPTAPGKARDTEVAQFVYPEDIALLLAQNRLGSRSGSSKLKRAADDNDLQEGSSKRHQGLDQSSRRNPADLNNETTTGNKSEGEDEDDDEDDEDGATTGAEPDQDD